MKLGLLGMTLIGLISLYDSVGFHVYSLISYTAGLRKFAIWVVGKIYFLAHLSGGE